MFSLRLPWFALLHVVRWQPLSSQQAVKTTAMVSISDNQKTKLRMSMTASTAMVMAKAIQELRWPTLLR